LSQERALQASGEGSKHGPPVGDCGDPIDSRTRNKVPSGFERVPKLPRSGSARPEQCVGYPWSLHLRIDSAKRVKIRPWVSPLGWTNRPPRTKPTVGGRPRGTKPEAARVRVPATRFYGPIRPCPRGRERFAPRRESTALSNARWVLRANRRFGGLSMVPWVVREAVGGRGMGVVTLCGAGRRHDRRFGPCRALGERVPRHARPRNFTPTSIKPR